MANISAVAVSAVPTATSAETAIATSTPANIANPGGQGNKISGVLNITTGASTTAVVIKVRSGSGLAGAVIGPAAGVSHTLAAGASASIAYDVLDPAVAGTGQQYTVSVAQTSGTVAGTVNYGTISVTTATAAT